MDEDVVLTLYVLLPCASAGLLWHLSGFIRARGRRPGWPQLFLGNALLFLSLLGLLLLGGECYYRFLYDTPDSLAYTKTSERWFNRYWQKNTAGFRDDVEYALAIPAGKRRVTFVGDSFTVGQGVKQVKTRFVNRLRQQHAEWEVHMFANLGLDTDTELQLLETNLSRGYQLDQVVLVYCLNDVSDLMPEWMDAVARVFADRNNNGWLVQNSYFLNTVYHRLKVLRNPYTKNYYHFVAEGYHGPIWERQKLQLVAFRDLVKAHGGRVLVVTFPFLDAVSPQYKFQFIHDQLNAFWSEAKVPHLDLLPVYRDLAPNRITVSRHDAHPNEYAHALAADAMDRFLKEQIAAKP
jgi:hypothetical protein